MRKIISLFLVFITLFVCSFGYTNANLETSYKNNIQQSSISLNFGELEYEEMGFKTRFAKTFLRKTAKLLDSDNVGIIESKFIGRGIGGDDLAKLIKKRKILAKKLNKLADDLDGATRVTTQMLINYLEGPLGVSLATDVANALMFIIT